MTAIFGLISGGLIGWGIYKILCGIMELPSNREIQMVMNVGKRKAEKFSPIDRLVFFLAHYVVRFIKIDAYKRKKLLNTLKSLGIRDSPEMIYAKAFVRGTVYMAFGFILAVISPLLTGLFVLLGVYIIFKEFQITDKLMLKRREEIEKELPRFVGRLEQELKYRTEVLPILEEYRKTSKKALGHDLELTISDMKSSNYESSLTRLGARIGSSRLSEVVRALIAVLRGDENVSHFHSLKLQFRNYERNRLEEEADKRVDSAKRYAMLLMIVFMIAILYPLVYDMSTTLPQIF